MLKLCLLLLVATRVIAGMDAQVAYGFHQLRDEKPFLASGPLSNKVTYGFSSLHGYIYDNPTVHHLKPLYWLFKFYGLLLIIYDN
jgi:hypothetical protein